MAKSPEFGGARIEQLETQDEHLPAHIERRHADMRQENAVAFQQSLAPDTRRKPSGGPVDISHDMIYA